MFQPSVNVKTGIEFRLLVFSSLFLSLNIDLNRDEDQQGTSMSSSNDSPQPVGFCVHCNQSLLIFSFSALTLLVGRQERHSVCKKIGVGLLVAMN